MIQTTFIGFKATDDERTALVKRCQQLINTQLPLVFTHPVRYNHCFARIILDWIFKDCWYNHLSKNRPAFAQLSIEQIKKAIVRMQQWIAEPQLLTEDNNASLQYRKSLK